MKGKPAAWHSARMAATLKTCLSGKMTKPEIRLAEKLGDAYAFVGDGSLMIGGLNPDFASKTGSRLVEMFGCYWHGCQKCFPGSKSHGIPLKQRLSTFKKHGYLCEIIWEHELEK
jgi:G:T-mismatch repair DNA endonuclease (very short patch repair protein)